MDSHPAVVYISSAYVKTMTKISCALTTQIVHFLYDLNSKFQVSSNLLCLYSPVCVGPGQKPRRPVFSQRGSFGNTLSMPAKKKTISENIDFPCSGTCIKWFECHRTDGGDFTGNFWPKSENYHGFTPQLDSRHERSIIA